MTAQPTLAALISAPGPGAVATVAVWGPQAWSVVSACAVAPQGRALGVMEPGRIRLARWGQNPTEDVVLCAFGAEHVEIHCHGGPAAVERLLGSLVAQGAVVAAWPAWIEQTTDCPLASAALAAMVRSVTERTAAILLDQAAGALRRDIEQVAAHLHHGELQVAAAALERLESRGTFGRHLIEPWQVVLAGPPNAGKSSLLNALVGYRRAIVHDTPGTTRDLVTSRTACDGWPIQLVDTAGLRSTHDPLEAAGAALAIEAMATADLVLWIVDSSDVADGASDFAGNDLARGSRENRAPVLFVANKCDLGRHGAGRPQPGQLATSALTGAGLEQLTSAIAQRLVPQAPPAGAAVPCTSLQCAALGRARQLLEAGNATGAADQLTRLLTR